MLHELIANHKAAMAQFEAACDALESKTEAYDKATEFNLIKVQLVDVSPCVKEGRDWLRGYADDIVDRCRRQSTMIEKLSPEFAAQFEAFVATTKDALYQKIDDALAEEERRQAEFGLTAAQEDWDKASAAETTAIEAIAAYRCKDHAEERARLAYVFGVASIRSMIDDIAPILVESVVGGPIQSTGAQNG